MAGNIVTFKVGEWVRVLRHVIKDPGVKVQESAKLAPRFTGPHHISQIVAPGAYRLDLPAGYRAHPVVSVQHLQKFLGDMVDGPGSVAHAGLEAEEDMYYVQSIGGHRKIGNFMSSGRVISILGTLAGTRRLPLSLSPLST